MAVASRNNVGREFAVLGFGCGLSGGLCSCAFRQRRLGTQVLSMLYSERE